MSAQPQFRESYDDFFDADAQAPGLDRLAVIAANIESINEKKKHADALFSGLDTIRLQSASHDKQRTDIEVFNCVVINENISFSITNLFVGDVDQLFFHLERTTFNANIKFNDLHERATAPNAIFHECLARLQNHLCLDILTVIDRLKKYRIA